MSFAVCIIQDDSKGGFAAVEASFGPFDERGDAEALRRALSEQMDASEELRDHEEESGDCLTIEVIEFVPAGVHPGEVLAGVIDNIVNPAARSERALEQLRAKLS